MQFEYFLATSKWPDSSCTGTYPEIDWYVYRDCYQVMEDWWEARNTWSGELRVMESDSYPKTWVMLKLRVFGKQAKKGRRCRPTRWTATYQMEGISEVMGGGKCKSLADAKRQALTHENLKPGLMQLLKRAFSREKARCVYHLDSASGFWEPWATNLGWAWAPHRNWPPGKYVEVFHDTLRGQRAYTVHEVSSWWSSGGSPPEDFNREVNRGWLDDDPGPWPIPYGTTVFTIKCGNRGQVKDHMGGMLCVGWPNGTSSWHVAEALKPLPSRYEQLGA